MVGDDDRGAGVEVFCALDDVEFDAGGDAHAKLKGARGEVLREAVFADEAEDDGGEGAVDGAEDEGDVGGEEAGGEGGVGEKDGSAGEGEEGNGEGEVGYGEVEEEVEDAVHLWLRHTERTGWYVRSDYRSSRSLPGVGGFCVIRGVEARTRASCGG